MKVCRRRGSYYDYNMSGLVKSVPDPRGLGITFYYYDALDRVWVTDNS